MRQYETFELAFSGKEQTVSWAQVDLTAVFTCSGNVKTVKGFYDGGGRYVVRFLPEQAGKWLWKVTGCAEAEGEETCEAAKDRHGPVRAVKTHFEYTDGKLFIPFGTTVYALASQEDALVEQTLESLKNAPFNKIRRCVFPKDYDYNKMNRRIIPLKRGRTDPGTRKDRMSCSGSGLNGFWTGSGPWASRST